MCILVVAVECHPHFPFLCAHNRDERRNRPCAAEQLEARTGLLCSRDLEAGGIVMGLHSAKGHFAALTNCRSPHTRNGPGKVSRGLLVEHVVTYGPDSVDAFITNNILDGFHLVFGNIFKRHLRLRYAWCCPADTSEDIDIQWNTGVQDLGRGVFAISNENCNMCRSWPKTDWLRKEVETFLSSLPTSPPPSQSQVQAGLAAIMRRCEVPSLVPPLVLPTLYAAEKEVKLHRGPFVPWDESLSDFGTVSQRIILNQVRGHGAMDVGYYHRDTNLPTTGDDAPRCGSWECIQVHTSLALSSWGELWTTCASWLHQLCAKTWVESKKPGSVEVSGGQAEKNRS